MNHITTPKGTQLPVSDLRGKPYLEVKYRMVWFREEHPNWGIETEFLRSDDTCTIAKATIKDETGRIMAMAHKREDKAHFADHMEKSETSAIGRALALCGYGTQFAPEVDEEDRIVDAPAEPAKKAASKPATATKPTVNAKPAATPAKPATGQAAPSKWVCPPEQRRAIFETFSIQFGMGDDSAIAYMKQITGKDKSDDWTQEDVKKLYAAIESWK